jgi:hypothetical protein
MWYALVQNIVGRLEGASIESTASGRPATFNHAFRSLLAAAAHRKPAPVDSIHQHASIDILAG